MTGNSPTRKRLLSLAGLGTVLAATALLVVYFPNPLFGAGIVLMVLTVILFLARPREAVILLLVFRSSLDAAKDYFNVYVTADFQITPATAVSLVVIIGGVLHLLARRVAFYRIPLAGLMTAFLFISGIHFFLVEDFAPSLMEFMRLLSGFLFFILVWDLCRKPGDVRAMINAILISALLPLASGLYQVVLQRGQFITGFVRAYGTFVHPNPYAFFLIIILALTVNLFFVPQKRKERFGLAVLSLAAVLCLLLSFTRTAWFGFLMIVFLTAWFREKKLIWLLLALVLVFSVLTPFRARFYDLSTSFNSLAHRVSIWQGGLEHLPAVPLLGRGLGSFVLMDIFQEPAHNDYLRIFFELGAAGLLAYLLLSVAVLVRFIEPLRSPASPYGYSLSGAAFSAAAVFLAASLLSNIFFRPALQWYFWALIAAALKLHRLESSPGQ